MVLQYVLEQSGGRLTKPSVTEAQATFRFSGEHDLIGTCPSPKFAKLAVMCHLLRLPSMSNSSQHLPIHMQEAP